MTPFRSPERIAQRLTGAGIASLIAQSNDISLFIDGDGIVRDVALGSDDPLLQVALEWIGRPWVATVTTESRPKIKLLLDVRQEQEPPRWRQVNHPIENGPDLPVTYKTLPYGDNHVIAVGRDLRPISRLQQRLLDVQHSLEADYARLHQAETRYRMLFDMATEAILIVDAETMRIVEANPAAGRLLDRPPKKLVNRSFLRGFSENSVEAIEDLLLRVRAAGQADSIQVHAARGERKFRLNATLIRREDGPYFLVRLIPPDEGQQEGVGQRVLDVIHRSTDCVVIADEHGKLLAANRAFLDVCQVATELQVADQPLDRWVGRPGVDVNLLMRNLRERGQVRQFLTTLNPEYGAPVEVELSAVSALDSDEPCFGFIMRRHVKAAQAGKAGDEPALPRSLQEMTELVGRVPLKDLVRETTDIIERMCIEAALKMTDDSRASAAEMLGLSRQSLYVKLRRYGLGEHRGERD